MPCPARGPGRTHPDPSCRSAHRGRARRTPGPRSRTRRRRRSAAGRGTDWWRRVRGSGTCATILAVPDLTTLLDPATTAVVTMECQRGVIGDLATFPALKDAVDA